MKLQTLPFAEIDQLAPTDLRYATEPESMKEFIYLPPSLDNLQRRANSKINKVDRELLYEVLNAQYAQLNNVSEHTRQNIDNLLKPNTYTLITAHQPNLLGGPLYLVYKIVSTIKLSRMYNQQNTETQVVPVFISGGEDHDFEEMNHLHLFGKRLEWSQKSGGPVGRYDTSSLSEVLTEYEQMLGDSEFAQELKDIVSIAYTQHANYGQATLQMINNMFGKYGLVVASMDNALWKKAAISVFEDDLINHSSHRLVSEQQDQLEQQGLKKQAYVRPINLFHLSPNQRQRIEKRSDDSYLLVDTGEELSKKALLDELRTAPQNFSPNVILRPLYQEIIFPNLAYIGGGGELAYWLERKTQFQYYGIDFPLLIRRDSVLWIDKVNAKKMSRLGLNAKSIWRSKDRLINDYITEHSEVSVSITAEQEIILNQLDQIKTQAQAVDPTLGPFIAGEITKWRKQLDQYENRMKRAEKKKNETAIGQLEKLKETLFPSNGLQERYTNFAELYLKKGSEFIDILLDQLNPLDTSFKILEEPLA